MVGEVDRVPLVFGVAGLVSIGLTGALIDKWLRPLILVGIDRSSQRHSYLRRPTAPIAIYEPH
jgi:hypothetical protein